MFNKLKKGGCTNSISHGKYTPDWEIVYKKEDGEKLEIYFIVKSKFAKNWEQLKRE